MILRQHQLKKTSRKETCPQSVLDVKRGPSPYKDNKETEKKHLEGNQLIGIRSMRWAI